MLKNKKDISIPVLLYFNKKDIDNYEGFYPSLYLQKVKKNNNFICDDDIYKITIHFNLVKINNVYAWVQSNFHVISGFDENNGEDILLYLNLESLKNGKYIINSGGRTVYPHTNNSTFRVFEQFV